MIKNIMSFFYNPINPIGIISCIVILICGYFVLQDVYEQLYLKPWRVMLYPHPYYIIGDEEIPPEVYDTIHLSLKHTKRGVDDQTSKMYVESIRDAMEDGKISGTEYETIFQENDRMINLIRSLEDEEKANKYKIKLEKELE